MVFCYGSPGKLIYCITEEKGGLIYNKTVLMLANLMYIQSPKDC